MDAILTTGNRHDGARARVPLLGRDALLLVVQLAALWNLWLWLGTRSLASGEISWELVPLISLFIFAWTNQPLENVRLNSNALILAATSLGLYAVSYSTAPPMARAVIAMMSLTFVISRWRFGTTFHPGVFTLLLLCLPVTDSLNFFLGYPMRVIVGEATAFLLNLQGIMVYRDGVNLQLGEKLVVIDAPCSGIKMLWFSILLATDLFFLYKLRPRLFLPVLLLTFAATMIGNIARSSTLFYLEGGLIEAPSWMHTVVGVIVFMFTSLAIALLVQGMGVKWRK